ncbi:MAG: sensor histidine kinase [Treponema sp.]|jgi:signal transduction histidine kinase|nr:sensor histidine kinase [Treponema sp.]
MDNEHQYTHPFSPAPPLAGKPARALNTLFYFIAVSLLFSAIILLTDSEARIINSPEQLEGFDFSARIAVLSPELFQRHPYALYTPSDFAAGLVTEPVPWGSGADGASENPSYITYRFVLDNLTEGTVYGISGLSATHAMRLWVDGILRTEVGVTGYSRQSMTARTNSFTVYFTASSQPTEIIVQRSSFVLFHGGRLNPLYLGEHQLISTMNVLGHVRVSVIVGITLMAALLYLGIFLFFRKQMQFFWFSAVCLMVAIRTIGIDFRLLASLFPGMDWHIDYLIGYLSTSGFIVFIILYLDTVFQKPGLNRFVKTSAVAVLSAHAVFILVTDSMIYSRLQIHYNVAVIVFSTAVLVNIFLVAIKNPEKRHIEHILILSGTAANVILGFAEVALRNATPQAAANYTQTGTLIFLFINIIALVLYFRRTENELAEANEQQRQIEIQRQLLAAENAALERVNRLRAEMVETISHEARTPLAILASYSSLIALELERENTSPQIAADLDVIAVEAKRVANLIDHMKNLPLQKDKAIVRVELDMCKLTAQTADLYHHILERIGVSLVTEIPESLPPVFGSPEELTQVVFNLLQNAKTHSEAGGTVTVRLGMTDDGELSVVIADTGAGIEPDILPHVFERGVYGRSGGSGLGLSICKEIVQAHGGRICIESEPGKGTKAAFYLPSKQEMTDV